MLPKDIPVQESICETCGKAFRPNRKGQRVCSTSCITGRGVKLTPIDLVCQGCGRTFEASIAVEKGKKYCSRACYHQSRVKVFACERCGKSFTTRNATARFCSNTCKRTGWNAPRACAQCGETFTPTRKNQHCCSMSCGTTLRHAKDLVEGKRPEHTELTCQHCGKLFRVFPSAASRRAAPPMFCSKACHYASRKGQYPDQLIFDLTHRRLTRIEIATYEALEAMGIDFEQQRFIGNALVDAYIPETRTVIEVQGDYWHCNPSVYPDGPKTDVQRARVESDRARFALLRGRGFRVIELWERDIRTHGAFALLARLL
jgi:G:T-mismatch repair DNA endonuclease (very short patch repair protein)